MGEYEMGNKKKYCLVISNDTFPSGDHIPEHRGYDIPGHRVDVPRLKDVFKDLLFEVKVYENKKAGEIDKIFKDLSENKDLLDGLSVLVCVILCHGDNGVIFGVDNEEIKLNNIFAYFEGNKCEALINIPKVFFIKGCQGTGKDEDVSSTRSSLLENSYLESNSNNLLSKADFLKGYSTGDDYNSWTDDRLESLYIPELCNELRRSAQSKDLVSILTDVNNEVLRKYKLCFEDPENTGANNDKVVGQMPSFKTTLRKDLYLMNKEPICEPICESTTNCE